MRASGGTARRLGRAWWPELLTAALLAAIACAGQANDPLFAIVEGIVLAAGWAMGRRHKITPLHRKVDRIGDKVDTIHGILADTDPAPEQGFRPRVVRLWTARPPATSRRCGS